MSTVTTVKDLGNRYGNLGSVLVTRLGQYFVVSGTDRWGYPEWLVVSATRTGRVTSWRDLATRDTKETALAALAKWTGRCHCGAVIRGRRYCPFCSCKLFAFDCGERVPAGEV